MFQHAIDTFGKVDVALANAGVSELGPGEFEDGEPTFRRLTSLKDDWLALQTS